ncbi:MAG: response regulator [Desulfobacula sp.]|nr:response regulator [Desulfobacula sp.]
MALIILAEDDPEVRLSIKLLVEDSGHECLDFPNGDEALDALRANRDAKLLISDIYMPSSDGRDIVAILRNGPPRFRTMPVILISGVVPEQTMKLHSKDKFYRFLKKPFTGEMLRNAVDSLI